MESPFRIARPAAGSDSSPPPPPIYVKYLPQGEIQNAWRSAESPHNGVRRPRGAKREGIRYQRRVESSALLDGHSGVELGPWFCFVDGSGARHYCQPDVLVRRGDVLVVAEIKVRWTSDAWWQLRRLYLPVLTKIFPSTKIVPLCICRSYDPSISVPDRVVLQRQFSDLVDPSVLNVMVVE